MNNKDQQMWNTDNKGWVGEPRLKRKNNGYDPLWCKYQSWRQRGPILWESEQEKREFFALHDQYGEAYENAQGKITLFLPAPPVNGVNE